MLKLHHPIYDHSSYLQPPSGGCVLKHLNASATYTAYGQPPSGGCVLKLFRFPVSVANMAAAAFGRLCVETSLTVMALNNWLGSRLRAAVC